MNSVVLDRGGVKRARGLTLVELIVVVAVMSIIASVAYPLYTNQMQKVRRADAKVALETLALAQERFYTINGSYADLATLASSNLVPPTLGGGASNKGYYDITVGGLGTTNQTYLLSAAPASSGPQDGDACQSFTLNQTGAKTATNDKCW
jgi:type IV pilus assembly protein PilE